MHTWAVLGIRMPAGKMSLVSLPEMDHDCFICLERYAAEDAITYTTTIHTTVPTQSVFQWRDGSGIYVLLFFFFFVSFFFKKKKEK